MKRTVPEYAIEYEDREHRLPCPECGSMDLSIWNQKTTMGKRGILYRDYLICRECYHVWQWVVSSSLFSSSKEG